MKQIYLIIFLLNATVGLSQTSIYTGFIDHRPIHLMIDNSSSNRADAIYVYDKYDTPITINGNLKNNQLTLIEKDNNDEITATLEFENYNPDNTQLTGKWISKNKQKSLPITLSKKIEFNAYGDSAFENIELLQAESSKEHYFKLLLSKTSDRNAEITAVKIFEKGTDKLVQKIDLYGDFRGCRSISIGDFNFDGAEDFSIFESSYAGANTSSNYILRNSDTGTYFMSGFSGTSLQFDHESKTITEHNQCCAGSEETISTYKVVNNKMVLIKKECKKYDEEKGNFVTVDCE